MAELDELGSNVVEVKDTIPKIEQKKEEITNTKKLITFAEKRIEKLVISKSDTSKIYALVKVNSHYDSLDLASMRAKYWLKSCYYDETGLVFSDDSYKNALETIYARAIFDIHTPTEFVYKRIAQTSDAIWYDLCNREGDIFKITKTDIYPTKLGLETPIFFRTRRQAEHVAPIFKKGFDALGELCRILKMPYDEQTLFKIHIISLFLEGYPMPIMAIMGEQGAIKSTITQTIKRIIDPTGERFEDNINKMPDKSDDLNLAIYANYLSAFDNLSNISHEVSDDLCRAVTGQLYAKRELYTDTDEVLLAFKRKIVLNGISPNMDNGDLLERAIVYQVQPIQKQERITLEEYEQKFNDLLPYILGQSFLVLQKALDIYPVVKTELKELPRMSDFAVWGEAISQSMGNVKNHFFNLYEATLSDSYLDASDSHAIVAYIKSLAENNNFPIKSKVSEFYNHLKGFASENNFDVVSHFSNFPKHHNKLKPYIKKVNPFIRNAGYEVRVYRYKNRDETKLHGNTVIEIASLQKGLDLSTPSSPSSPSEQIGEHTKNGEHSIFTTGEHGEHTKNAMLTTSRHDGEHGEHGEHLSIPLEKDYKRNYQCKKCHTQYNNITKEAILKVQEQHQKQHGQDHEFYEVIE